MSPSVLTEKNSKPLLQLSEEVIQRELAWLRENERIQFYEPNGSVSKLIELIGTTNNLIYTFSAANGVGKTTFLVNLAGNIIFGPQNKFFDFPIFRNWPFPKRLRFVSEPSQVKESGPFPTEIQKWWPKGRYSIAKDGQHYGSLYRSGDWILEVMTYEQAPEQHEGANLGLVLFNEPPPKNLWTPNISRLRAGGIGIVGMTPLNEAGWYFDEVIPRHEPYTVYADIETACQQHGTRGHLDHDQIEKMIAEYSPEEREARIDGKAMYLKGIIFKTFYPNVHVLKEAVKPPFGAPVWNVVDPHSDKPFASIWAFPDARGDIYIFDEWPNEDFTKMHNCQLTIQDYKKIFGDKEAGLTVYKRVIDRHFADVASSINKRTLRQELQALGLNYVPSYKAEEEIDTGIEKVRRYLAYDTSKPLSALNQPKFYVNPHCINTIKSLSRWSRDAETGKIQEAYKDFCDVTRYLLMEEPKLPESFPAYEPKKRWG